MLEAALAYPTRGENGLGRLLVGGVLVVLSVLVVPIFLVYGYAVRTLGAVAAGEETPPPFEDWAGLMVDGLKAAVIGIAYSIVPYAIAVGLGLLLGVGAAVGGERTGGVLAGAGVVGALLTFLAAAVVTYLIMAALTNFAVEGRMGAAFDWPTIKRVVTADAYIVAFGLVIAVYVGLAVVFVVGTMLTLGLALFVFLFLAPFVGFWLYLVMAYLFGTAYRRALDAG